MAYDPTQPPSLGRFAVSFVVMAILGPLLFALAFFGGLVYIAFSAIRRVVK